MGKGDWHVELEGLASGFKLVRHVAGHAGPSARVWQRLRSGNEIESH